jgi:radical SAM superfamily enzyme YgiQ (UPF0313 family)
MRVLLISANRERSPFPVAPIGVLCVAGAARAAGHEVEVLDLTFQRGPVRAVGRAVRRHQPDVVGIGIRNLDNCSFSRAHSFLEDVREVAEAARRATDAPLVLGGGGFSVEPVGWLQRLGADYGVVGEGEGAFVALLDALAAAECDGTIEEIPGVLGRVGSETRGVVQSSAPSDSGEFAPAPAPPCDLGLLPEPLHAGCRYRPYERAGGSVSVQSKRGCPFRCIYCIYPLIEGRTYRLRAPDAVGDEIERVVREQKARDFFFTDSVFNSPPEHAAAICRDVERRRLGVRWMAYCNPVGFDGDLARAMVASGCAGIEFGLDVAVEKMFGPMGKPFGQDDIGRALEATHRAGLPTAVHLLFGGPGETLADIEETQRFLNSCATVNAVFASVGLRIYSGTSLEGIARHEGVLAPETDLFEPTYYVSAGLGDDPLAAVDAIARRRWEWSTPSNWYGPLMRVVQGVINRTGTRPQWRDVRNYGKYMRRGGGAGCASDL